MDVTAVLAILLAAINPLPNQGDWLAAHSASQTQCTEAAQLSTAADKDAGVAATLKQSKSAPSIIASALAEAESSSAKAQLAQRACASAQQSLLRARTTLDQALSNELQSILSQLPQMQSQARSQAIDRLRGLQVIQQALDAAGNPSAQPLTAHTVNTAAEDPIELLETADALRDQSTHLQQRAKTVHTLIAQRKRAKLLDRQLQQLEQTETGLAAFDRAPRLQLKTPASNTGLNDSTKVETNTSAEGGINDPLNQGQMNSPTPTNSNVPDTNNTFNTSNSTTLLYQSINDLGSRPGQMISDQPIDVLEKLLTDIEAERARKSGQAVQLEEKAALLLRGNANK